jgi:hypothetical protein
LQQRRKAALDEGGFFLPGAQGIRKKYQVFFVED